MEGRGFQPGLRKSLLKLTEQSRAEIEAGEAMGVEKH
jgi:hypothetical protein